MPVGMQDAGGRFSEVALQPETEIAGSQLKFSVYDASEGIYNRTALCFHFSRGNLQEAANMSDKSDSISVLALIVSVLSAVWTVGWSVFTHRQQQRRIEEEREREFFEKQREREEQGTEKVKTDLSIQLSEHSLNLCVSLYNSGKLDVHIKNVELHCSKGKSGSGWPFAVAIAAPATNTDPENLDNYIITGYTRSKLLPVREGVTFSLAVDNSRATHFKSLLQMPAYNVWISVLSPAGEIARVEGVDVFPIIEGLLEVHDALVQGRFAFQKTLPPEEEIVPSE